MPAKPDANGAVYRGSCFISLSRLRSNLSVLSHVFFFVVRAVLVSVGNVSGSGWFKRKVFVRIWYTFKVSRGGKPNVFVPVLPRRASYFVWFAGVQYRYAEALPENCSLECCFAFGCANLYSAMRLWQLTVVNRREYLVTFYILT